MLRKAFALRGCLVKESLSGFLTVPSNNNRVKLGFINNIQSQLSNYSTIETTNWKNHTNDVFSIKPSYLSPLFATYQNEIEKEDRRNLLLKLLKAHNLLSEEVEGLDKEQIHRSTRYRISQMKELAADLRILLKDDNKPLNLTQCSDKDLMYGFFNLLESQAMSHDIDAEALHKTDDGAETVWEHWATNFVEKYKGTPALEPLEVIFSRQDPMIILEKLRNNKQNLSTLSAAKTLVNNDARMDADGVVRAIGRRKSAIAHVAMRRSNDAGRITVNGMPYDAYFRDVEIRTYMLEPFFHCDGLGKYDIVVNVEGSGPSAQSQAIRTAMARALRVQLPDLASEKLDALTIADNRRVERKKPGLLKARRAPQWVKR